jgi:outer membrane protein assembly factor BamB
MADPRKTPLPVLWSVSTPDDASLVHAGARHVVARCGGDVLAFDAATGAAAWSASLPDGAGEGSQLTIVGATTVTDVRTGAKGTTVLVGLRGGKVVYRTPVDAIVGAQATAVIGETVYVLGTDPRGGSLLRSIDANDGKLRLDVRRSGRDLAAAGERLVILSSFGEPGLVSLDAGGKDERVVETIAAQDMAIAGDYLLAALRTGDAPRRTARLYDLRHGRALWSHDCHGAVVGLDHELALHIESSGGSHIAVARDVRTGEVRWRSSAPLGDDSGVFRSAGALVAFTHGTGTTMLRRSDGERVAELSAIYALEARAASFYLEGSCQIACVDAHV